MPEVGLLHEAPWWGAGPSMAGLGCILGGENVEGSRSRLGSGLKGTLCGWGERVADGVKGLWRDEDGNAASSPSREVLHAQPAKAREVI